MRQLFPPLTLVAVAACTPRELEPPRAPPAVAPEIPSLPAEPPPPRHGRVLFATEGEPALVSHVDAYEKIAPRYETSSSGELVLVAGSEKVDATPLCVTPCAADLPVGAHRFAFTPTTSKDQKSMATVGVSEGTIAVRHVMEQSRPMGPAWLLGFAGAFFGAPLTLGGVSVVAMGTFGDFDREKDARSMQVLGAVTLGIGAALLTTGVLAMNAHRGTHREGATTTFPVRTPPSTALLR